MLINIKSEITYPDLDTCKRELNISSVEDDNEMLLQFLREGTTVYFFIDPYTEDLSDGQECVMCWNLSRTKAEEQYDINCEEI